MATFRKNPEDVHMSVQMRRVSDAIRRMPPEERIYLLVKAKLMTEDEYQQAISRLRQKNDRRKPKSRRKRTDTPAVEPRSTKS